MTEPDDPTPASTQALIEGLADQGEYVEDGHFTLDPRRALDKLRDYQLADPEAYILLVIEAAFVGSGGDTRVNIELGRTTTVEFTGLAIGAGALDHILAAVFRKTKTDDPALEREAKTLKLLALALNGALALDPSRVSVEITGPDSWVNSVELGRDRKLHTTHQIRTGPAGRTRFVFESDTLGLFRGQNLTSFIHQHCRYSRLSVFVDGKLISEGSRAALTAREVGPISETPVVFEGETVGVGGFTRDIQRDCALIHTRGVLAEQLVLPGAAGFIAVVEVDLDKDLSQSRVVRNERFEALRHAIQQARETAGNRPKRDMPEEQARQRAQNQQTQNPVALVLIVMSVGMLLLIMYLDTRHEHERDLERGLPGGDGGSEQTHERDHVASLMSGVLALASPETIPGSLATTEPAFPVATARSAGRELTMVAASQWRGGRVVALASEAFISAPALAEADTAALLSNAVRWAHGPQTSSRISVVCAHDPAPCQALDSPRFETRTTRSPRWYAEAGRGEVLIVKASAIDSQTAQDHIQRFMPEGGLVIAGSGWIWHQDHPETSLEQGFPGNLMLRNAGIRWGEEALDGVGRTIPVTRASVP